MTATQFLNPSILSLVGKQVQAMYPVRIGSKVVPAGFRGEILSQWDNGLGQEMLTVCWQANGDVDLVRRSEVEVME